MGNDLLVDLEALTSVFNTFHPAKEIELPGKREPARLSYTVLLNLEGSWEAAGRRQHSHLRPGQAVGDSLT